MRAELVISPEAYDDLAEAMGWYDKQRVGLGEELFSSVHACIESVLRMPTMHARVVKEYRRALVRRFPYAIYYEYVGDVVTVYGVIHTARDSSAWRDRLS